MPDLMIDVDHFNVEGIKNKIQCELNGTVPDVIVGISMGGLIAPHLAKDYPTTKLIMIASGPKLKTKIPVFNFLIRLEKYDTSLFLWRLIKRIPKSVYLLVYKTFSKYKNNATTMEEYINKANENWNSLQKIPINKVKEVLKFATETDNTDLLTKTVNKTIIIAGRSDKLMPQTHSEKMAGCIKQSRLVTLNRAHYDIFTHNDYALLYDFLN